MIFLSILFCSSWSITWLELLSAVISHTQPLNNCIMLWWQLWINSICTLYTMIRFTICQYQYLQRLCWLQWQANMHQWLDGIVSWNLVCDVTVLLHHDLFLLPSSQYAKLNLGVGLQVNPRTAGVIGWISDSYCSIKPLCSGMGEVLPARTSPTLLPHPLALCCHYPVSKCCSASIVVTSTVRVKSCDVEV